MNRRGLIGALAAAIALAAVPKKELGEQLRALEALGIEPERVDLDAMALFRAAEWAGCFGEEVAAAAAALAYVEKTQIGERPPLSPPAAEAAGAAIAVGGGC